MSRFLPYAAAVLSVTALTLLPSCASNDRVRVGKPTVEGIVRYAPAESLETVREYTQPSEKK